MKSQPISTFPTEVSLQRYLKHPQTSDKEKANNVYLLKIFCIVLFTITGFNSMFTFMMMYKNAMITEENLRLIQENRQLINFQQMSAIIYSSAGPSLNYQNDNSEETERFSRMIEMKLPNQNCPPCTTEKPSVIQPHKNPVSILNELTAYANYDCEHVCLNPPIHISTLIVGEDHMQGKTFSGKGESKQKSKQAAAYRALQDGFPQYIDEVADEYKPDLDFNPSCNSYSVYPFQIPKIKC